jgi:hypothetical protein
MGSLFGIFSQLFLVYLICISQVQSHWLLTQPCDGENRTSNIGTYTNGFCRKALYGDDLQISHCVSYRSTWITQFCPRVDVCQQCWDANDNITMNRCIEGSYSSCTTAARPDFKKLRWDAVAIEMHETEGCHDEPNSIFIAQQNKCFNYPSLRRSLRLTFCFLLGRWI